MKRKAEDPETTVSNGSHKKQAIEDNNISSRFRANLFASDTVKQYTNDYATSEPYKHAVVSNLIDDNLLRSVRSEILENIRFTLKETDIYKIHQSGDLANLDGLAESALQKLPSLLQLRNALYSYEFRQWLSTVTGAGLLSGKKTDMAVNVYVPGCHLLCHDDVIGSRRVSYILYLTDPDVPWQSEWGGALRLYPTEGREDRFGEVYKLPSAEWSKVIPPAWNQLSFFAVQPGESFHDVEEVYQRTSGQSEDDGGRYRMAISGWFHIPQEGEEGYEPGLEELLAEKSSLQQLQGKAEQFDEPQLSWYDPTLRQTEKTKPEEDDEEVAELSETDLAFLLQYMTPQYLTPDTVEELNEIFTEESTIQLSNFLNPKFAERLKAQLEDAQYAKRWEAAECAVARPPHKHRYQFRYSRALPPLSADQVANNNDPLDLVLNDLLPSLAFRKWLSLATGLTLTRCAAVARRFRRGLDYQLAQAYEGEDPLLEYCLCVTPSSGWGGDDDQLAAEDQTNGKSKPNQDGEEEDNVGGYEAYMAGEESDDDDEEAGAPKNGVEVPTKAQPHTGAGDRRNASRKKADPAIYKAASEEEDDSIIVSNVAGWNVLNIVLRDKGTLRFVKYVSQSAKGDRWDFTGSVEVVPDDDGSEEDEEEEEGVEAGAS